MNLNDVQTQFKWVAILEGFSFIAIGFTMYLKYNFDMKQPNYVVGMIHGFLFIAYCLYIAKFFIDKKWNFQKSLVLFLASLVPFGTFWAVKHYKI